MWPRREGSLLGPARLMGGWTGHAAAPSWMQNHAGAGWGSWESPLQLSGASAVKKALLAAVGLPGRGVRGTVTVLLPFAGDHNSQQLQRFSQRCFGYMCGQAAFRRRRDKGLTLDFFQSEQESYLHSVPCLCPSVCCSDHIITQMDLQTLAWGGWVLPGVGFLSLTL